VDGDSAKLDPLLGQAKPGADSIEQSSSGCVNGDSAKLDEVLSQPTPGTVGEPDAKIDNATEGASEEIKKEMKKDEAS
jgi:hypothetical protein